METQQLVPQVQKKPFMARVKQNYALNKPKYLQSAGYVGIGLTAAAGAFAGYKIPKAVEKAKKEIKEEDSKCKRFWKYFKHVAPVTAPVLACSIGTGMAFHGAYKEQARRLAVVGAAYAGAMAELQTLKKKVKEVGGEKIAKKVKQAVQDEEVGKVEDPVSKSKLEEQRNANPNSQGYMGTDIPYYDPWLQKIIWTNRDKLVDIQSKMLAKLECEDVVDMSTFYEELGYGTNLKPMPKYAYDYGWSANTLCDRDYLRSQMPCAFFDVNGGTSVTKDGIPCMYIEFFDLKLLTIGCP